MNKDSDNSYEGNKKGKKLERNWARRVIIDKVVRESLLEEMSD